MYTIVVGITAIYSGTYNDLNNTPGLIFKYDICHDTSMKQF